MTPVRVVVLVLALSLVGIGVGVFLSVRSYAPLEWAGGAFGADVRAPGFYDRVESQGADGERRPAYVFRHRPGQTFRFGVDVYNAGRFPIRIEAVEPTVSGPLRIVGGDVQRDPRRKVFAGAQRLPYDVEPHEYAYLVPRLRSGRTCGASGTSQGLEAIRVRYSYLGMFERVQTIRLPMTIVQACGDPEAVANGLEGA